MTVTSRGLDNARAKAASDPPDSAAALAVHSRQNWVLGLCAALFALSYLCFWPHISTTMDESAYLGFAYVLRHGTFYAEQVQASILLALSVHGHLVSKYPLGMPALLAVTSLFGWSFALGTNLIIHLLSYAVVIRLLRRLGLSPFYAILYLLHPTAVLYSRTVMSDLPSGLVLALAFERYLSRRYAATGALLGFSILLRTANAVALPLFLIAVLIEQDGGDRTALRIQDIRARIRPVLSMLLGSLPFLALAGYYSAVVAGGQMAKSTGSFGLMYFPMYFPGYVLALLLVYPGMLLAPALYHDRGKFIPGSLCYSFVILYSFWYFRDQGGNAAESLIVGQRYFLAVLPLYIVSYSMLLNRLATYVRTATLRRAISVAALLVMAAVSVLVQIRHAAKLQQMIGIRDAVIRATAPDDLIYCNTQVGKLLVPWNNRRFAEPTDAGPRDTSAIRRWMSGNQAARPSSVEAEPSPSNDKPRLIFASWVREGRSDDQEDGERITSLEKRFDTEPITTGSAPDLHVRYIIEKPSIDRSVDPSTNPPIGPAR